MNVLFDFSAIKTGGGVQLAHNFLSRLDEVGYKSIRILLPPIGELTSYAKKFGSQSITSKGDLLSRGVFEYGKLQTYLKDSAIDCVYTFFGAGIPHPANVRSIVSVAYPIICYPDSAFWKYCRPAIKYRQYALNFARCARLVKADFIIAETPVMKRRLAKLPFLSSDRISVSPPAPTEYVSKNVERLGANTSRRYRILILGGLAQHKNVWRLNQIIDRLLARGFEKFVFVISANYDDYMDVQISKISTTVIDRHIEFRGSVSVTKIDDLYSSCDVLLNLSDLESFSNNYMEAWKAGIPLLCSNRDFALEICRDSAVYCEPHDPESVACQLETLLGDNVLQKEMVLSGYKLLDQLPNLQERFESVIQFIEDARGHKIR